MNLGAYLHIPFCRQKCDYCGFYSIPVGRLDQSERAALLDRYADRLVGEIVQRANDFHDCAVDTVYFGGGTPSLLAPETVARVMEALRRSMDFAGGPAEVTLECNPEDFSPGRIKGYRDAGINRVVLGIQTLERENREFIGRSSSVISHGLAEEFMAVEGIGHCLDLIIGIPSKKRYLPDEIGMIADLGADHISAYLLSVEEHTPLAGRFVEPEDFQELQREAFMAVRAALVAGGYHHYEVSNYCLPGRESRHNMKYWKFMPYAGFGPGAHSFYGGERFMNQPSLDDYMNADIVAPVKDARGERSMVAEYVFTGMRLFEGVSAADFENTLGIAFPADIAGRLKALSESGHVCVFDEKSFRAGFTLEGMMVMDTLLGEILDGYI